MSRPTGKMDQKIEVQRYTESGQPGGQRKKVWAKLTDAWAEFNPREGAESFSDHQEKDVTIADFRIYWFAGLLMRDRIIFDGDPYNIVSIRPTGQSNREYWIIRGKRTVQGDSDAG